MRMESFRLSHFEIFTVNPDGSKNIVENVSADYIVPTNVGFALYISDTYKDKLVYVAPSNCGARKLKDD